MTFEVHRCNNDIGNKGVAYMMRQAARHVFGFRQYGKMIPRDLSLYLNEKRDFYHRSDLW